MASGPEGIHPFPTLEEQRFLAFIYNELGFCGKFRFGEFPDEKVSWIIPFDDVNQSHFVLLIIILSV